MIERRAGRSAAERFPVGDGYRIVPFADQEAITHEDVRTLWAHNESVRPEERERRLHELHMIALHDTGGLAGVSTAYIAYQPQLAMPLWHYRVYVAPEHRTSGLMIWLAREGRKHLSARFASGRDARAGGVVFEMEARGVERAFPHAYWFPTGVSFVGLNAKGLRVRVHYFPHALAPDPPRPDIGS